MTKNDAATIRASQDRRAQSNLRNALTAEKVYFVDSLAFTNVAADLSAIESSLDFTTDDGWAGGVVVEELGAADSAVMLRSESRSGTYFCVLELAQDVAEPGYEGQALAGTYFATSADDVCSGESWSAGAATGW